jgi:hypothetical protein
MHNHNHTANSRILALDACPRGVSAGNPRTVTPLQNAHYSVTVLDAQVRPAIKRYHVEVVSLQAELVVELAPGDFCGNGPITLRVEGALPHYTYLWSTGETTSEIQVPLSGMAAAYRVTVADARQDGAGVWKTCEQALEIRTAEALAAVDAQKCELLYSRLEALGFEAREVKIVEPVQAIAPRSRASATCNVVDHTDFRVEWYEETLDPASILCSELAEMEGVTQGFIYASDDICTEADLAEVEALINDETLLHVYLKPCGGEEYGVLMEKGAPCYLKYAAYLNQIGIYDVQERIEFCNELSGLNDYFKEPDPINSRITILNLYVPSKELVPGRLIAATEYRYTHNPPDKIAADLKFGYFGDDRVISEKNQEMLSWPLVDLENKMIELLHWASIGPYQAVADKFFARFKARIGLTYTDSDISNLIKETVEVKNKIKQFGEDFEKKLRLVDGDEKMIDFFELEGIRRFLFTASNGYLLKGPTILINDVSQVKYHIQSFNIDTLGNWEGTFYVETIDHFGLDDADPEKFLVIKGLNLGMFQNLHSGFAAWWILQHKKAYRPFITKLRFVTRLKGKI